MEDTKWLCSMFTHWFCPSLKVVSTSRLPAEFFDKSGPRQLIPSPGAIFYYNSMNNEYYTKNVIFVKKRRLTLLQLDSIILVPDLSLLYFHNEWKLHFC